MSELITRNEIRKKLDDTFDVNFSVSEIKINTIDEFYEKLYLPFQRGDKKYYRGERLCSKSRGLVPTFLRKDTVFPIDEQKTFLEINGDMVFNYYNSRQPFMSIYSELFGNATKDNMYKLTAFAQHYLDVSPFIDFTKNLLVALSFAIKDRTVIKDDIVIYTAFDVNDDDTSGDEEEINHWLENYSVSIINTLSLEEFGRLLLDQNILTERKVLMNHFKNRKPETLKQEFLQLRGLHNEVSPCAKMIDLPTNDLMKYQQGVFLLLTDFYLIDSKYLTKSVRQNFEIDKYIINSEICNEINNSIMTKAPQYRYKCLLNISEALK